MFTPELSLHIENSFLETNWDYLKLPPTRILHAKDVSPLCERDIAALRFEISQRRVLEGQITMTVLPTAELIGWLHGRAEFFGLNLFDKIPLNKGAICEEDSWIFWHHDFRKRCLYIQRMHFIEQDEELGIRCLAALLVAACREAKTWGLPFLITWDTSPKVHGACMLLKSLGDGVEMLLMEKRRETISIRAGVDQGTGLLDLHPNEHFAWN